MKYFKYCCLLLILLCFVPFLSVKAATLSEFKSELDGLKKKYEENETTKKKTEAEIKQTQSEIATINNQIDELNTQIDELNADIEARNQSIDKMHEEIKSIVHYYQVTTVQNMYYEYVFNADSYTDFIYRFAITEQLSQYREKTINEYNRLIEENKQKVSEIASKKTELSNLENQVKAKYDSLNGQLTGITTAGVSIQDEIAAMEKKINTYQNTYKCSDTEEISACVYRYNHPTVTKSSSKGGKTYNITVASSSGFYLPISYWTKTYPFLHHDKGFDLTTPEGQEVHPVADGTVSEVWHHYRCGGNMVWIVHNINGKKYTSAYYHLKSYNVSVGDSVSHNDVIGISGGIAIGNSYNTYDGCTTGPHLHLQLATGWYDPNSLFSGSYSSYSAFDSNSFNPVNVINF